MIDEIHFFDCNAFFGLPTKSGLAPIQSVEGLLEEMERAADPVNGAAPSFDAERALRKHIGDYALFVAGMYPEAAGSRHRHRHHSPSLAELIRAGKESYFIVSQFNLFEYEQEAPLFARLSDGFERCILGLTLVREEIGPRKPLQLPPPKVN